MMAGGEGSMLGRAEILHSVLLCGSFQFLSSPNVSLAYIWPHIDSLLFCFTGSVRPVLLVIFRLSGSLYLSP